MHPEEGAEGRFTVETLAGKTYPVQLCESVGQAKAILLEILLEKGLPYKKTADMRFLFDGRELHDRETLDQCGVSQSSIVYLSIRRLACPCCKVTAIKPSDSSNKKRRRTTRQKFGSTAVVAMPHKLARTGEGSKG